MCQCQCQSRQVCVFQCVTESVTGGGGGGLETCTVCTGIQLIIRAHT